MSQTSENSPKGAGHGGETLNQSDFTALAAQPEGETIKAAQLAMEEAEDRCGGFHSWWEAVEVATPILTSKLHARVATLEAEKATLEADLARMAQDRVATRDTLRGANARCVAERDRLREALDHLVHLYRGVNKGGLSPATSDWDEAWTEADAALTGGGR